MDAASPVQASPLSNDIIRRKPLPVHSSVYIPIPQRDDPSSQASQPKWKRRYRACVLKYAWAPEIASIVLALAMLAAIIILLTVRQHKPLPSWPSVLGINSLVAIFSSVFKVALLYPITEGVSELKWIWFAADQPVTDFDRFDAASRGPWGALKLLVKHPLNLLASLGAVITILSLGVDPFTQQVLRFYNCPTPVDDASSTIGRLNNYTAGDDLDLDLKLQGALYQGMLNPPANATVAISTYCPTGNCTFTHFNGIAYSSLAVCTSVVDITDSVQGTGQSGEDYNWAYSLPSGLEVNYPIGLGCRPLAPLTFANASLFDFEVLAMTTNCTNPLNTTDSEQCSVTPFAAHVSIVPCVNEYGNVSITNSILYEQLMSSSVLPFTGSSYLSVGNSSSFPNTDCSGSESPEGNKTVATSIAYSAYDFTFRCPGAACLLNNIDVLYYNPTCIFNFDSGPLSGLRGVLPDIFGLNGNTSYLRVDISRWPTVNGQTWILPMWASGSTNLATLTKTMQSFADTLTAVIRAEGALADNNDPARGDIKIKQTCVGVEWAWIALSCTLLAFTIVFLISTMIHSHNDTKRGGTEEGRKPWKSSTLPLLWCGLQDATKVRYGRLDEVDQMKDSGDGAEVRLQRGDAGRWELGRCKLEVAARSAG